ncbi:MAG TPA: signal peptidase I [Chthonomonadaceae bacterium]|nr:signal peptidase I [Chthonomonadaceae bacterium]
MSPDTRRQAIFVAVFLIVVVMFVLTFRLGVVHGQSMAPTYQDGQVVLVRRRNLWSGPLHHDDVVLVRKDRDVLIKRIYLLPGEELTNPAIVRATFVNNVADYYEQQITDTPRGPITRLFVPEGFIVVLGDNRRVSDDSRQFGPVPIRNVLGVVVGSPPPPTPAERAAAGGEPSSRLGAR